MNDPTLPPGWVPYSPDQQSGHQGDASKDAEPDRRKRLMDAYRYVASREYKGATWKELADRYGLHHGQASGALSNLHRIGDITRLKERRGGCGIYVALDYVDGRVTVPHKSNRINNAMTGHLLLSLADECRPLALHDETCWQVHARCALIRAAAMFGTTRGETK